MRVAAFESIEIIDRHQRLDGSMTNEGDPGRHSPEARRARAVPESWRPSLPSAIVPSARTWASSSEASFTKPACAGAYWHRRERGRAFAPDVRFLVTSSGTRASNSTDFATRPGYLCAAAWICPNAHRE